MPYRNLGPKVPSTSKNNTPKYNAPNPVLKGLANFVESGAENVAGLVGLPGSAAEYLGAPKILPTSSQLVGGVRGAANSVLPEGYIVPEEEQTRGEKFVRNAGAIAPFAARSILTGGAGAIPTILHGLGQAAGSTAGEELGFGPLGGLAGGIAGGAAVKKGFNALGGIAEKIFSSDTFKNNGLVRGISNFFNQFKIDPGNLTQTAQKAQSAAYNTERELGKNIDGNGYKFYNKLSRLEKEIDSTSALTQTQASDLKDIIQKTKGDIKLSPFDRTKTINASALVKRKQQNNAKYKHFSGGKNKEAREYLDRIQKTIFEQGDSMAPKNFLWRDAWQSGDDITKVLKYGEELQELAKEAPTLFKIIKSPLAQFALGGLGVSGGYLGKFNPTLLGLGAIGASAYQGKDKIKYATAFLDSPATAKILADVLKYTSKKEIGNLANSYKKLNREAEKYTKENAQPSSSSNGRYRRLD